MKKLSLLALVVGVTLGLTGCAGSSSSNDIKAISINKEAINVVPLSANSTTSNESIKFKNTAFGALIHNNQQYFYSQGDKTSAKNVPNMGIITYNGQMVMNIDSAAIINKTIENIEKQQQKIMTKKERDDLTNKLFATNTLLTLLDNNLINFTLNFDNKSVKVSMKKAALSANASLIINNSSSVIIDENKFYSTNFNILFNYDDATVKFKLPITFTLAGQFNGSDAGEISGTFSSDLMQASFGAIKQE